MDDGRRIGWLAFLQPVWHWLRQPWLLLLSGGLTAFWLLSARAIPQLPSLLVNDPAASARWLRTTAQAYGANGPLAQALGLFDVLHSPMLHLLMLWMGLLLAVHLGDQMGALQQLRMLPALFQQVPAQTSVPLLQSTAIPLEQRRYVKPDTPEAVAAQLMQEMQQHFSAPQRFDAALGEHNKGAGAAPEPAAEIRLLGMNNVLFGYLRLLLVGGILAALIIVWWISQQSWDIPSLLLAPGESVRYGTLQLGISYAEAAPAPTAEVVTVQVQLGETIHAFTVDRSGGSLRLDSMKISGQLGPPGLQVSTTDGARMLSRPAQAGVADAIGLGFPSEGDEEFILIPNEAAALRILRAASGPTPYFLVEVYNQTALDDGNAQPVQRFEVTQRQEQSIPVHNAQLTLIFDPQPSVVIQAQSLPGLWLLWPALAAIVIGAASLFRRASFQLIQIAPWPEGRSTAAVIIAQGSKHQ
ncbi:MAG: hypothetical protein H6641_25145 [Caldilineaceae bacterium]|nr:hypothetical protein [Caldilineaceae bacterium]